MSSVTTVEGRKNSCMVINLLLADLGDKRTGKWPKLSSSRHLWMFPNCENDYCFHLMVPDSIHLSWTLGLQRGFTRWSTSFLEMQRMKQEEASQANFWEGRAREGQSWQGQAANPCSSARSLCLPGHLGLANQINPVLL